MRLFCTTQNPANGFPARLLGEGFSAHSPRVGMAQDLSAAGAELPELMTAGRWESPTMPARYTEAQTVGRGAVARYYRGDLRESG